MLKTRFSEAVLAWLSSGPGAPVPSVLCGTPADLNVPAFRSIASPITRSPLQRPTQTSLEEDSTMFTRS